jgi:hypothetical protein
MFPVKTKRLLSAIATTEQTLLYSARGLVLEDDDNNTKDTTKSSDTKESSAKRKDYNKLNEEGVNHTMKIFREKFMPSNLVSDNKLHMYAHHEYYCKRDYGIYNFELVCVDETGISVYETISDNGYYIINPITYEVHKMVYPNKAYMIPNTNRYAVGDMSVKSLGLDINKPNDVIKYGVYCLNKKKCEAMKELGLNKDIKEDCIKYMQMTTMDSFEADGKELEQCWENYLYHPKNNEDLRRWLEYMAPSLINCVEQSPNHAVPYIPYIIEGSVDSDRDENSVDSENEETKLEHVEKIDKRSFSKRGIVTTNEQDLYITPTWCIEVLIKQYINVKMPNIKSVYDPCCGTRVIGDVFRELRIDIQLFESDLYTTTTKVDFLEVDLSSITSVDCVITNPPYGNNNKTKFLKHCYESGKPFMLLLPIQTLNTPGRISLFMTFGIHLFYISPSPVFLHNDKEVCIGEMAWFIWDGNIKPKSITFSYGLKQSVMSKLRNFSNITTLKNTQINNMFIDDELHCANVLDLAPVVLDLSVTNQSP